MTIADRNPTGIQAPRVGAQAPSPAPALSLTTSPTHPTSTGDGVGGQNWVEALEHRGVISANARALVVEHPGERISSAVAWFDSQPAGSVGPGLLVRAVNEGRAPAARRSASVDEQRRYGERICAWLCAHFPDLCTDGQPHPAAGVAVIRLHYRDGKGALTKAAHGAEIRAAVRAFDAKWLAPVEGETA